MLLIVDDDTQFVQSLTKCVDWSLLGITRVETAGDGAQGLRLFERLCPDILLCDVQMPVMNGIEMARRIADANSGNIPCAVVFMTAYSEREYLKSAIRLRAIDYLDKPFSPVELSEALLQVTRQDGARSKSGEYSHPINMVIDYIQLHYAEPLTIEMLASMVYLSPNYFSAIFKKETGKTVLEHLTEQRMAKACYYLRTSNRPLSSVAPSVGYQDFRYFSRAFRRMTGFTPSEYRKKG